MDEKDDNVDLEYESTFSSSVDSYVLETEDSFAAPQIHEKKYFRISNNFKFEHTMLVKLKDTLDALDAICVTDISTIINYTRDIDYIMLVLADIHHTLKILHEFDKTFKLKEVNNGHFTVKVLTKRRKSRRRIKRRHKRKVKL